MAKAANDEYEMAVKKGDRAAEAEAVKHLAEANNRLHAGLGYAGAPYSADLGVTALRSTFGDLMKKHYSIREAAAKEEDDDSVRRNGSFEYLRQKQSELQNEFGEQAPPPSDLMESLSERQSPEAAKLAIDAWASGARKGRENSRLARATVTRAINLAELYSGGKPPDEQTSAFLERLVSSGDPKAMDEMLKDWVDFNSKKSKAESETLSKSFTAGLAHQDFAAARSSLRGLVDNYSKSLEAARKLGFRFPGEPKPATPPPDEDPGALEVQRASMLDIVERIKSAYRSHEKQRKVLVDQGLPDPGEADIPDEIRALIEDEGDSGSAFADAVKVRMPDEWSGPVPSKRR